MTSYRGKDRFSFCIQDGEGHVRYDFPAHSTHNCVELQQQLMQMFGAATASQGQCRATWRPLMTAVWRTLLLPAPDSRAVLQYAH